MKQYAIGTDIGGSHMSAVLINLQNSEVVPGSLVSNKVDKHASAESIFKVWSSTLGQILKDIDIADLAGIGFAMPGPFDYKNGIALFTPEVAKYENLYGLNVAENMKKMLSLPSDLPLRFINDATAFAIGEAWIGKAADYEKSIAITLGTGFGSAFIESGIPVTERNDVPEFGNFWHLPFKNGIADDSFSTRWFTIQYLQRTGKSLPGVKEIADLANEDTVVKALFEEFGNNLGEFMGPWINKFGAECIVIGGNMVKAWDLFGETFLLNLNRQGVVVAINLSELGETSAMIGSARLIEETFWNKVKHLI